MLLKHQSLSQKQRDWAEFKKNELKQKLKSDDKVTIDIQSKESKRYDVLNNNGTFIISSNDEDFISVLKSRAVKDYPARKLDFTRNSLSVDTTESNMKELVTHVDRVVDSLEKTYVSQLKKQLGVLYHDNAEEVFERQRKNKAKGWWKRWK